MEQQDLQVLHRVREQRVKGRTALANQIRGLLNEYEIILPQGIHHLRGCLPALLEDAENGLSDLMREVIAGLYERLQSLEEHVVRCERRLE
jgi:transposase